MLIVASGLLHTPPVGVLLRVMLLLTHTTDGPLIAAGSPFTVTTAVLVQPVPVIVYVIVLVPAVTPVITPAVLMVATDGVLLLQVPPGVVLLTVVVSPAHT